MKDDEPIVWECFAGWTTVGQHVAVGHAIAEVLFGGLLQQTGGLPATNLLRQAVATDSGRLGARPGLFEVGLSDA